jgi:hypothetical protein
VSYKTFAKLYDMQASMSERSLDMRKEKDLFRPLNQIVLTEATRSQLIAQSKNMGKYKDQSRGATREARKKYSKIANTVKQYNQIDMNNLFKKDLLQVTIPVVGETSSYNVTIKMDGVVAEIAKNIKNNSNKLEYRTIIQALTKVFNSANIYVKCDCPDYKYTFAH